MEYDIIFSREAGEAIPVVVFSGTYREAHNKFNEIQQRVYGADNTHDVDTLYYLDGDEKQLYFFVGKVHQCYIVCCKSRAKQLIEGQRELLDAREWRKSLAD